MDFQLFPKDFINSIGRIPLPRKNSMRTSAPGAWSSSDKGDSMEFLDFRSYVPGDDLRKIDWNIFRRSKKLFVREYHCQPDKKHLVVIDNSKSIRYNPDRAVSVWRIVAMIGGAILAGGDRLEIKISGQRGVKLFIPGNDAISRLLQYLSECFKSSYSDSSVDFRYPRNTHVWVVSDFYDVDGLKHLEEALRRSRGFTPVRIYEEGEDEPALDGELRLIDVESSQEVAVAVDNELLERYKQNLGRFKGALNRVAARSGSRLYEFKVTTDVKSIVRECNREIMTGGVR